MTEQRFTKQVGVTLITKVLGLCLSIVNAAIIARWLGPEGKGMLALALLVPGMLGLFLSGGIGVANVYFAGSRRLDVITLTANSLGFAILATILGFGIIIGLATGGWLEAIVPGVPIWILIIAILAFPTGLLKGFFSSILQGLQRIFTLNLIDLSQGILTLSLTILFVIGLKLSLLGALVAPLASGFLSIIVLGMLLRREGGLLTPRLKYSAPCFLLVSKVT